jgi:hypothetical protein
MTCIHFPNQPWRKNYLGPLKGYDPERTGSQTHMIESEVRTVIISRLLWSVHVDV